MPPGAAAPVALRAAEPRSETPRDEESRVERFGGSPSFGKFSPEGRTSYGNV